MAITKIKVSNFKSFDELEVDLRPLNVVVGGNASGKSNFLEIFRFLRDLNEHGVENAVSLQGGMEYLANVRIGTARPVVLEVSAGPEIRYKITLQASESGYEVSEEPIPIASGMVRVHRGGTMASVFGISLLDFDPKLPKRVAPRGGKAYLEPDGSNLAVVIKNLLQDPQKREVFLLLLRDLLPFVDDLKVESFLDRSLLILLKESFGSVYLPAAFLSDGTIQIAALVLALYFEESEILVLEEPDRNIHPHLISRLASMMDDVSAKKQVIATTHNPELVKQIMLENLLLVQRDRRGFSRIYRPAESAELKIFLENNLGVEDLYVQNLLDIGHGL